MVLNIVMAVMTGFETELKSKVTETNSHIIVRSLGGRLQAWEGLAGKISELPGVESVSPSIQQQALLRTETRSTGILIRGLQEGSSSASQVGLYLPEPADLTALFHPQKVFARVLGEEEKEVHVPGIVIGEELAKQLALSVGNTVSVLTPQVSSSPFGLVPRFRRFVVTGIYHSGLIEYESGVAYIALDEAQRFFDFGTSISALEVRVHDIEKTTDIVEKIVDQSGGLGRGVYAQDWKESNKALWDALRLEKKVYFIVLLLIVVMASFSIITTLIMLVLEKRKDIAILRTLGASSSAVRSIFLLQGSVIGFLGTSLGLLLGYLGCIALQQYGFPLDEKIFQMSELPVKIIPVNFLVSGLSAFAICCAATLYPSARASKVLPSEALRY
jgi:lipoprotein-releasing system permease protein